MPKGLSNQLVTGLIAGLIAAGVAIGAMLPSSSKTTAMDVTYITRQEFKDTINLIREEGREARHEARTEWGRFREQLTKIAKEIGNLQGAQRK